MIAYFTRHPVAANLLLLSVMILGGLSLPNMERESFPEFLVSNVSVTIVYPGASAADVDEQVCLKLDKSLDSINELKELECLSVDGRATAILTMKESEDIGQFYNDVSSAVSAINDLPAAVEAPLISIEGRTEVIAFLAVSGIGTDESLIRSADRFASDIAALPGVASVDILGISENELRISFDQNKLRRFGIGAKSVADAVAARSLQAPIGTVSTQGRDIILRYSDARRSIPDLESLVILQNERGGFVRLSDLASVSLQEVDPEARAFIDGERAAILRINKSKEADAIDGFAQVQSLIMKEQAKFPDPFKISVINNSTEPVRQRIDLVSKNAAISLVLVILVMCLFFSVSEAIWISLALPFSFFGGIVALSAIGVTINMISLVALLMAIGLIMDDSIAIAENIATWRAKLGRDAVVRGVIEVMPGVISSFLTTACVFGPLMFLSGEIGAILKVVPIVLLITLTISLVEAFLILPNHLSHVRMDSEVNARRLAPRILENVKEKFVLPISAFLAQWRYATVGAVVAVLISCISLIASGTVKVIGFPSIEGNTIEARVALSSGLPLARTEAVVDQLTEALKKVDADLTRGTRDGQQLVERVLVSYASNSDVKDNGAHTATITVDLLSSEERNVAADDVLSAWRHAAGPIPDLVQSNFTQTTLAPGGLDLDVQLASHDLNQLEQATTELRNRLLARNDVTDAYQDFYGGRPEIGLKLNEYAYAIGLTPQLVTRQLQTAFSGTETDSFRVGLSDVSVRVELGDTVPTISDLEEFPVAVAGGKQVTLGAISDIDLSYTYGQITRQDGKAIARILGKIDRGATTSAEISALVTGELAPRLERDFPGVGVSIGGAAQEQLETQASILAALLTGLTGVYLVLAFQFRSYTLPFAIMLSIPFALTGVILGHLLMGLDLAMPSFVGFASLAGIVVNNAILFMTFFKAEIRGGDCIQAAVEAVRRRFRPVLLSFLTTFIGLMPIVAETSPQAQPLVPLVVSVAFGLLASTVLVVFVFPSILGIYFDFKSVEKWQATFAENAPRASEG